MKILRRLGIGLLSIILLVGILLGLAMGSLIDIPPVDASVVDDRAVNDPEYQQPIEAIQNQLDTFLHSVVTPSLSLAVSVNGKLVWSQAIGYADIATNSLANTDTVYPIGSVSKSITAVLVSKLVEDGTLDLDKNIREYLPSFPEKKYSINLRQLLSHQAGVRHYDFALIPPYFSEAGNNNEYPSMADSLTIFADDPLLFEPDTDFSYSTYGYTLISAVIEAATEENFLDLLAEVIFAPLNMTRSGADTAAKPPANRITGYSALLSAPLSKHAVALAPITNSSYKWAGGGLTSTPTDLVAFGEAVLQATLLSAPSTAEMFSPRKLLNGELNVQHYGLGFRIGGLALYDDNGEQTEIITLINHGGTSVGSICSLLIVPDYNLVVAMSANSVTASGSGPLMATAAKVARAFIAADANKK